MTSVRQLAESLNTNHTKVSRLIKKLEQSGTLKLEPISNGQSRDLSESQVALIKAEFLKNEPVAISPVTESNFQITQKSFNPLDTIDTLSVSVESTSDYVSASRQSRQHNMNISQSNFERLRKAMLMMAEHEGHALGEEVNAVRLSAFLKQQNLGNLDLAQSLGLSSQNQ